MIERLLSTIASTVTIGFGVWHFFVPKIYGWYSYIDENVSELITAIRATNVFFSLSLVLIGTVNIIFAYFLKDNHQGFLVLMIMSSVLWFIRVIMQLCYPQGSINPALQYGMLSAFIIVFAMFFVSAILVY